MMVYPMGPERVCRPVGEKIHNIVNPCYSEQTREGSVKAEKLLKLGELLKSFNKHWLLYMGSRLITLNP